LIRLVWIRYETGSTRLVTDSLANGTNQPDSSR